MTVPVIGLGHKTFASRILYSRFDTFISFSRRRKYNLLSQPLSPFGDDQHRALTRTSSHKKMASKYICLTSFNHVQAMRSTSSHSDARKTSRPNSSASRTGFSPTQRLHVQRQLRAPQKQWQLELFPEFQMIVALSQSSNRSAFQHLDSSEMFRSHL